jgi:phosphoribosylaminoimidazole carboxylase PurE protein
MDRTPTVGIVMGSDSDLEIMQETAALLGQFNVPYEISIISAHRTPAKAHEYSLSAESRGLEIIIAAAGGAAHLAGTIAAWTVLPVIGVPMQTALSGGLDSLLSTVQMPAGVPVATVATGKAGAKNAAILAVQILSVRDSQYRDKIRAYKAKIAKEVEEKNNAITSLHKD